MRPSSDRIPVILLGFLLLMVGAGSLLNGFVLPGVILLLLGLVIVDHQLQRTTGVGLFVRMLEWLEGLAALGRPEPRQSLPRPPIDRLGALPDPHPEDDNRAYAHALDAMQSAGHDPQRAQVQTVDIGVMAFTGQQPPVLYRSQPVPTGVDYIQPFVILRLPTTAMGRVRFEIARDDGQPIFIHEDMHDLPPGRTLIMPTMRLPLARLPSFNGRWQMRVSADGVLLAVHRLAWNVPNAKAVPSMYVPLKEDGELRVEVRTLLERSRLEPLTLDELLAPQDEGRRASSR